jgi:hypothetical protein
MINETERISFYYDDNYYTLGDCVGEFMGVYTLDIARNYHPIEQGEYTEVFDEFRRRLGTTEQIQRAIELYLTTANVPHRFVSLRGYSQAEWADVLIYGEGFAELESYAEPLQAWFRGDVFVVAREKLNTYTSNYDPSQTIEQWELQGAIGNVLFTNGYSVQQAAEDYAEELVAW